jgi:hypothetical protein
LLREQALLFDRLLDAVSDEYAREAGGAPSSIAAQRRVEKVRGLLAGEPLDTAELAYDFGATHLGAVASGEEAQTALRGLAASLGCRLLLVDPNQGCLWGWLGSRERPDADRLKRALKDWPSTVTLGLGEWSKALAGWRLTHRQALAALPIAARNQEGPVRYGEVALLASCLGDDLLMTSLRELFLEPLGVDSDETGVLCQTLRAYFATNRNITSAAARLGVSRQTVRARLRAVEEQLGRTLDCCGVALDVALELQRHRPSKLPVRT